MSANSPAPSRYYETRVPLSGSNVRTVTFEACRDCGSIVVSRFAHDADHAARDRLMATLTGDAS